MNGVLEWFVGGSMLATVGGIIVFVVKAGPEWLSIRAKRDNLHADTAARVQAMSLEYAERLEAQLKTCLEDVARLREALREANAENDQYRSTILTLPAEFQRRFRVVGSNGA